MRLVGCRRGIGDVSADVRRSARDMPERANHPLWLFRLEPPAPRAHSHAGRLRRRQRLGRSSAPAGCQPLTVLVLGALAPRCEAPRASRQFPRVNSSEIHRGALGICRRCFGSFGLQTVRVDRNQTGRTGNQGRRRLLRSRFKLRTCNWQKAVRKALHSPRRGSAGAASGTSADDVWSALGFSREGL
jgi:hypothetical protein